MNGKFADLAPEKRNGPKIRYIRCVLVHRINELMIFCLFKYPNQRKGLLQKFPISGVFWCILVYFALELITSLTVQALELEFRTGQILLLKNSLGNTTKLVRQTSHKCKNSPRGFKVRGYSMGVSRIIQGMQ
jgi:hypothetical protein